MSRLPRLASTSECQARVTTKFLVFMIICQRFSSVSVFALSLFSLFPLFPSPPSRSHAPDRRSQHASVCHGDVLNRHTEACLDLHTLFSLFFHHTHTALRRDDFVEKCLRTIRQTNDLIMILEKIPVGRIVRSKVQNLTHVCKCLPDSNSNFRPARINSELISGSMVLPLVRCWKYLGMVASYLLLILPFWTV